MRRVKQRAAGGRLRRPLVPIAVALVALVAAGGGGRGDEVADRQAGDRDLGRAARASSSAARKPITLAVEDGFGVNAWSQESYAAVKSTAAQCKNVKVIAAAGGGVLSTMISDINSAVAQGANAMTVIPDFGQAELPALQAATKAGVKVVPWGANPGGNNGSDYVGYVDWNDGYAGTVWANWMVQALHGHGNVIYTGGPAGNPVGADQLAAIVRVFANHPGMHLLTGDQTLAGDQLGSGDGGDGDRVAALAVPEDRRHHLQLRHRRARERAGVPERPGASSCRSRRSTRTGSRACTSRRRSPLQTISSRNWLGRIAARKAIAAAEGITNKRAVHLQPAVLRGHAARQALPVQPEGRAGLLSLQQAHGRADQAVRQRELS